MSDIRDDLGPIGKRQSQQEVAEKAAAYVGKSLAEGRVTGHIGGGYSPDTATPRWHIDQYETIGRVFSNALSGRLDDDARQAERCLNEAIMWATRRYRF